MLSPKGCEATAEPGDSGDAGDFWGKILSPLVFWWFYGVFVGFRVFFCWFYGVFVFFLLVLWCFCVFWLVLWCFLMRCWNGFIASPLRGETKLSDLCIFVWLVFLLRKTKLIQKLVKTFFWLLKTEALSIGEWTWVMSKRCF